MNILLLFNSTASYHHFFNALVRPFANDGVHAAVGSAFSRTENGRDELGDATAYYLDSFSRGAANRPWANGNADPACIETLLA